MNTIKKYCAIIIYQLHRLLRSNRYKQTKIIKEKLKDNTYLQEQDKMYILKFLRHNLIKIFNYDFTRKYEFRYIHVKYDKVYKLPYIITEEKHKLYFPAKYSKATIRNMYNNLCIEQDEHSPHNYCFDGCPVTDGIILADVGSAEGNFSLKFIDKIKKLYLFEYSEQWQAPLKATFTPWADQVTIVRKFVSDKDDNDNVSLDKYFENKEKPTLIKMDVEGAEGQVFHGAQKLLQQNKNMQLLVATYHKQGDDINLSEILKGYGYNISLSKGYMFFDGEFRRGMLHAF
jgi:hypothetical protein